MNWLKGKNDHLKYLDNERLEVLNLYSQARGILKDHDIEVKEEKYTATSFFKWFFFFYRKIKYYNIDVITALKAVLAVILYSPLWFGNTSENI